jgi:hypothetical protein
MLNVILLSVVMLSAIMLNVILMSVIMLFVVMLSILVPYFCSIYYLLENNFYCVDFLICQFHFAIMLFIQFFLFLDNSFIAIS